LAADDAAGLAAENNDIQILVSDGLSAEAVHHNLPDLLPTLTDGLARHNIRVGKPILVRFGRVKLAEQVADLLGARLAICLIGERPGGDALASRSLSAYLVYRLTELASRAAAVQFSGNPTVRFEYTVVSNIYAGGLPPVEAGAVIVEKALAILSHCAAGNRLEAKLHVQPGDDLRSGQLTLSEGTSTP
jgi:ethanolamine ammonia-lyase large subunit